MTPAVTDGTDTQQAPLISKAVFPDGIKTSGTHPPLYDRLASLEDFPEYIDGPTVWEAKDYANNPERWIHQFSPSEVEELSQTADAFIAAGYPLTGISQINFHLPTLSKLLASVRGELLNGKGFILFKGLPVQAWGNRKSAVAYMGLGTYLGYFVSQNGRGHVLGHVKDLGEDSQQIDSVRIYRTNARQFFHTDDGDLVGLLCMARALEGGESDLISSQHIYNVLRKERPDVLKLLTQPIWYFDRKGEMSHGDEPYIRTSVFYKEPDGLRRVFSRWDPYYVKSLSRFSDSGIIPPLSASQIEAMEVLEKACLDNSLHMILEVGDIQFLSNQHIFHARTAYIDHEPPEPRRHLMRLWLATPEDEGGWVLPFKDSKEKKRGGIQVNNTPPYAPLDAE